MVVKNEWINKIFPEDVYYVCNTKLNKIPLLLNIKLHVGV